MGCFHTLQPQQDPYLAPNVPTLTIQGFVRFQTIQLLLAPDLHASILQNAVKRLDLINPADGLPFPDRLPRNALPSRPDPEIVTWHGGVAENLRIESNHAGTQGLPTRRLVQVGDAATEISTASFDGRQSVDDTAHYSAHPRPFRPPPSIRVPQPVEALAIGSRQDSHPWDLERRRSSISDSQSPFSSRPWPGQGSTPHVFSPQHDLNRPRLRSHRTTSTSSISSSSSSSLTTSSVSISPRPHHRSHHHHRTNRQRQFLDHRPFHHERRHSSHGPYSPREAAGDHNIQVHLPARDDRPSQHSARPPDTSSGGSSNGWGDRGNAVGSTERSVYVSDQISIENYKDAQWTSREDHDAKRAKDGILERSASPLRGVGGRRYAAAGTKWD